MQAKEIANRLKQILPLYTADFSDLTTISSLTRSGSTITAITSDAHGLASNDYITIKGAKEPIAISSITRVGNIVSVITSTDHKLSDPSLFSGKALPLYVALTGTTPTGYSGTFELLTVPDSTHFTFKITTTPTTPATVGGYLLLNDFDGYNGYKQITVIDTSTFTYPITGTPQSPAQGTIQMSNASRVGFVGTTDEIVKFYTENSASILKSYIFVYVGTESVFKDDTTAGDISSAQNTNADFFYQVQQDFSLFVIIPRKGQNTAGIAADLARSYKQPILKSVANYAFLSVLVDQQYQSTIFVGSEPDENLGAFYTHRFDFMAKGYIQNEDTADFNNGFPLELIDGAFSNADNTFKPEFR